MRALAFDIGGTNVRAGIVDADGAILGEARGAIQDRSPFAVAHLCARVGETLEDKWGQADVVGAGLAAMISAQTGRVEVSPNLEWRDVDFAAALGSALGRPPPRLLNDLDAICLGEADVGAAKGAANVVCVYVGTGVGSGFLLAGRPYSGFRGVGAELGHIKMGVAPARVCGCGASDCLEAYVGGRKLTERVRAELSSDPSLANTFAAPERVELDAVDALAANGHAWAAPLWDFVSTLLGRSVANVVTLLNPEVLVMGGGVWEKCPALRARTLNVIAQNANGVALTDLRIVDAALGDSAGLLGAAAFARQTR